MESIMNDDFKKFLRSHDVKLDTPAREFKDIESSIFKSKRRTTFYRFGMGVAATLTLIISFYIGRESSPPPSVVLSDNVLRPAMALSDEQALEFIESSYSYLSEEDEVEGEEYLRLAEES